LILNWENGSAAVTQFIFKVSKSTEAANRRADVKETAGYAIRTKTTIDIFWRVFACVGF
jgi:hypothetical protein